MGINFYTLLINLWLSYILTSIPNYLFIYDKFNSLSFSSSNNFITIFLFFHPCFTFNPVPPIPPKWTPNPFIPDKFKTLPPFLFSLENPPMLTVSPTIFKTSNFLKSCLKNKFPRKSLFLSRNSSILKLTVKLKEEPSHNSDQNHRLIWIQ